MMPLETRTLTRVTGPAAVPSGDWLHGRASVTPDRIAIIIGSDSWSYAALDTLVDRFCLALLDRGVRSGDHIALRMPNSLAYVLAVHAVARLGGVLVPLNLRLAPGELSWQLERADCRWLLGELPERFAAAAGQMVPDAFIPLADSVEALIEWLPVDSPSAHSTLSYEYERIQGILFTSGTTGRPKGVMLSFGNHYWSAIASLHRLGTFPDDRWLVCLPLYHVGGLAILLRSCLYGTTAVIQPGFDTGAVDHSLRTQQVTIVSLVPTMLHRLLAGREEVAWPQLRHVLLGGAAASSELVDLAHQLYVPLVATYGLTEASSQVATQDPTSAALKVGSAGRPLRYTDLTIRTEAGQLAEPGEAGEIVVSGPTVMAGYYADETATRAALRQGGLHTGDVGYLDEDGDLWLLGRRTDLIVTGGENVYPAEIERVLRQHPLVTDAAVVGLAHVEWGQQVAALVVPAAPGDLSEAELTRHCRLHLAGYKCPRLWAFTDALPLTGSGKVSRKSVAAILSEGVGDNDALL